MSTCRLFAYGTLRFGGEAKPLMQKVQATVLERDVKLSHYRMFNVSNYPIIYPSENPNDIITGDIFKLQDIFLPTLDSYEGIEYSRTYEERLDAWIFIAAEEDFVKKLDEIKSGNWLAYTNSL